MMTDEQMRLVSSIGEIVKSDANVSAETRKEVEQAIRRVFALNDNGNRRKKGNLYNFVSNDDSNRVMCGVYLALPQVGLSVRNGGQCNIEERG